MNSIKIDIRIFFVILMVILIPFSYFDPFGFRVVVISFLAFLLLVFFSVGKTFVVDNNVLLFLIPFLVAALLSIVSGSKNIFSLLVFFSYLFIFNFIGSDKLREVVNKVSYFYLYGAFFMAVGVIVQRLSFEVLGYEFGKIDLYGGGRVGFGFLWLDYSFLSLYLVASAPIVFYCIKGNGPRFIILFFLLVGSAVTTARTGLAALFFVVLFWAGLELFKTLLRGNVSKKVFYLAILTAVIAGFLVYYYNGLSTRTISFSDSGRFDGFVVAFRSFLNAPFLGVMFDSEYYRQVYGVVPHNLFFYILSHGGILFFVFFFLWFSYVLFVSLFRVRFFGYSVVIVSIGFMFVPSFFSAYFFAFLVAMSMAEKRVYGLGVVKNEKSVSI